MVILIVLITLSVILALIIVNNAKIEIEVKRMITAVNIYHRQGVVVVIVTLLSSFFYVFTVLYFLKLTEYQFQGICLFIACTNTMFRYSLAFY